MIPQTIRQIFQETGRLKEKGWTYSLQVRELADHHILNLFRLECFKSYILSPYILSPYILSPYILSPFVADPTFFWR